MKLLYKGGMNLRFFTFSLFATISFNLGSEICKRSQIFLESFGIGTILVDLKHKAFHSASLETVS